LDEEALALRPTEVLNEFPNLGVRHLKSRTNFSPRLLLESAIDLLARERFVSPLAFEEVVNLLVQRADPVASVHFGRG
jgi:hypothetical protein